jgi:hypothetical protein
MAIDADFVAEDPKDGATDKNQRQQDPKFGEQAAAGRTGVIFNIQQ